MSGEDVTGWCEGGGEAVGERGERRRQDLQRCRSTARRGAHRRHHQTRHLPPSRLSTAPLRAPASPAATRPSQHARRPPPSARRRAEPIPKRTTTSTDHSMGAQSPNQRRAHTPPQHPPSREVGRLRAPTQSPRPVEVWAARRRRGRRRLRPRGATPHPTHPGWAALRAW